VTAGTDDQGVSSGSRPVAVCVVRLEHQGDGLLITLRMTLDVRTASGEWRATAGSIDETLAMISEFAERFHERARRHGV
jgi:hypothetical protein